MSGKCAFSIWGHMEILKKIVLLGGFLCCHALSFSQGYVVSSTIPDFTDLNASCVVAAYGNTNDPFLNAGVVNGCHTVIRQQGTDSATGGGDFLVTILFATLLLVVLMRQVSFS